MTHFEYGDRIARDAILTPSSSTVIFSENRTKVLLTQRTDNGKWCLPGGMMDAGESAAECAVRETLEETGLTVRVLRLIGVYSNPHRIVVYPDGNRRQYLNLMFECVIVSGELSLSDETTDIGWFTQEQAFALDLLEAHVERLVDAWMNQPGAVSR